MIRRRNDLTFTLAMMLAAALCIGTAATAQSLDREDITDRDITLAIETDLMVDDAVPSHRIDVTTTTGIVELAGTVPSILARDRAVERARSIKGVRSVVDKITVDGPNRPDAKIHDDVERALRTDPATDAYELEVSVTNGIVTLTGVVDSWQEKELATIVAKGTRDVINVRNRITIDYQTTRTDYEIEADVERRLGTSVWVDGRFIDVAVKDGVVTLSGTAGSEAARQHAATMAWVAGVTDVKADDIAIDWWAENRMRRENRFYMPADTEIASAIEAAMVHDARVFSFNVNADVRNGVATLTGTVDNLSAKRAAAANASNTIGVWRVRNHLRVRPMAMPDDMELARTVRDALGRDPYVERHQVDVGVAGGTVYLSGDVDNEFEREQAEAVAARVNGVVDVQNNLDFDHEWTRASDLAVELDVEWQLFWSPFVDSSEISVDVENGVATLTGTVNNWTEWRDATKNAFEGNARDVRNKLEIAGS